MLKSCMLALYFIVLPFNVLANAGGLSELSLVGISDGFYGVKRYCQLTGADDLTSFTDYILKNNGKLSATELVSNCQELMPEKNDTCDGRNVYIDETIPANVQCRAYIGTAIKSHNKMVQSLTKPGTYVRLYNGTGTVNGQNGVYSVVGVVQGGSNNIYEIRKDGTIRMLPFKTHVPETFLNVDTNNKLIGVHNHSVIYTQLDMAQTVSEFTLHNTAGYMATSAQLAPNKDLDLKRTIGMLYKTPEQKKDKSYGDAWADTNAALYNGEIWNFEQLGHFVFGGRAGQSGGKFEEVYHFVADDVQEQSSGKTAGQGKTDSANHKNIAKEATSRYAGKDVKKAKAAGKSERDIFIARRRDNKKFVDTQTANEVDAYGLAEKYIRGVLGDANSVKCWGVCGAISDDIVTCSWSTKSKQAGTIEFVFDDICDSTTPSRNKIIELDKSTKFENVQTKSVHEGRKKVENYIRRKYNGAKNLVCSGECDLVGDDDITCTFKYRKVVYKWVFEFDDLCD